MTIGVTARALRTNHKLQLLSVNSLYALHVHIKYVTTQPVRYALFFFEHHRRRWNSSFPGCRLLADISTAAGLASHSQAFVYSCLSIPNCYLSSPQVNWKMIALPLRVIGKAVCISKISLCTFYKLPFRLINTSSCNK